MKGRPRVSRLMWAKRAQEYLAKINTGDPEALAEVVRDLQSADDGSGSSFSQRNLFELALDRLAGEFAAVRGIAKPDAIDMINQTWPMPGQTVRPRNRDQLPRRDPRELCWQNRQTRPMYCRRRFSAWVYRTLPMRPRRSSVLPT